MVAWIERHGYAERLDADAGYPAGRTPVGIAIGSGAVGMIGAALVAASIPITQPGWRFAVIAVAVGAFGAVSLDQTALAAIAVLGFLISNGFLEDRFGQLAWHGSADLWRALLLVMAGALGLATGEAARFVRDRRPPGHVPSSRVEEEKHGA